MLQYMYMKYSSGNKTKGKDRYTYKHGMARTRFYRCWMRMRRRCSEVNDVSYKYYGGRGITVCDRWQDFQNFYADMFSTYSDVLSIDRIDNDGNYEPNNCRWATNAEQSSNKRSTHQITYNGVTKSLPEWAEEKGLKVSTLWNRLFKYKWPVADALNPVARRLNKTKKV